MHLRLLAVTIALSASGCLCGGGSPVGECTGTWGGRTFDHAQLDDSSRVTIIRKMTCGDSDTARYDIFWDKGAVALNTTLKPGPALLNAVEVTVPPSESRFLTFSVTPSEPAPKGTLKLEVIGIGGRRTGTLTLADGAEQLVCSFDAPYDTEGRSPSCGSGDADFD